MDKDSREILAIRRDWDEDDKDAQRKRMYVKYPYVPGPGVKGLRPLTQPPDAGRWISLRC